ncbi:TetR/AcrR family transcriptional regulator [Leisingera sp. S132]|uniref:TetR/AcrR family transcriptional regulator n=1 Tax=Leisingera sp. S132 TaxID=2867016 RepID=UPI0021A37C57|nr:TetR/AcrR family transcriptional regulator [Leisingera sp. S132]UWQ80557.1 TetR/AcrR family transcriptional regulator [Leisingera sp. S132]
MNQRLPSAERSKELIEIAKALFVDFGPEGVKLREIARQAGVSAPSVYNHFASLEDLLAAILEEHLDDLLEVYAAISTLPPERAVRELCKEHTMLLAENPAAAHLLMAHQQLKAKLGPLRHIAEKISALNTAEAAIFKSGESQGVFQEVDFHDVTLARLGMTTTILSAHRTNSGIVQDQVATTAETVSAFVLKILKATRVAGDTHQ